MNFKSIKEGFLTIWQDPVWSKVISVGIIGLVALAWAKITNHTWTEIYDFVLSVLSFKLPVYLFLSTIALYFIVKLCIKLFRKGKDPLWDEQIGNYTFKELHNILVTETLPVRTRGMEMGGIPAPTDNCLTLFRLYYITLNKGFGIGDDIGDRGYLHSVFAPRMVGYGLVEAYQKPDDNLPEITDVAYKTSELGHKFHSSLDKVILAEKIKKLKSKKGSQ